MRSFQPPADTRFYAGVDLHARSLYLVVLDADGQARFGKNLPAAPEPFLRAVQPFRDGLLVLPRARLRLVRQRAELYGHVHTAPRQANLPPVSNDVKYKSKRAAITADITDPFVRRRVETDLALLEPLDTAIRRLEAEIEEAAQEHYPTELAVLQTTPGVGAVLALTILLETDTIGRFASRQQFCSYA